MAQNSKTKGAKPWAKRQVARLPTSTPVHSPYTGNDFNVHAQLLCSEFLQANLDYHAADNSQALHQHTEMGRKEGVELSGSSAECLSRLKALNGRQGWCREQNSTAPPTVNPSTSYLLDALRTNIAGERAHHAEASHRGSNDIEDESTRTSHANPQARPKYPIPRQTDVSHCIALARPPTVLRLPPSSSKTNPAKRRARAETPRESQRPSHNPHNYFVNIDVKRVKARIGPDDVERSLTQTPRTPQASHPAANLRIPLYPPRPTPTVLKLPTSGSKNAPARRRGQAGTPRGSHSPSSKAYKFLVNIDVPRRRTGVRRRRGFCACLGASSNRSIDLKTSQAGVYITRKPAPVARTKLLVDIDVPRIPMGRGLGELSMVDVDDIHDPSTVDTVTFIRVTIDGKRRARRHASDRMASTSVTPVHSHQRLCTRIRIYKRPLVSHIDPTSANATGNTATGREGT
ncbi:hypothetical protein R3P38DRAFT_3348588 [Favolaschia claudopus]|uniref:Uncharacterized protein n=1 Tax=Favolaschia claudopus TaxID=2862362 RepID=A0AAW0CUW8_9AGAR